MDKSILNTKENTDLEISSHCLHGF